MKHMKRFACLVLVLMLALSGTVFAQDVDTEMSGDGSITIKNTAIGETYAIYKLFDATVNMDGPSIAYTTADDIPAGLNAYFQKDGAGNITATEAAMNESGTEISEDLRNALKTWAASETAVKTEVAEDDTIIFTNAAYGYYVVTSTQGTRAIMVDSTNPSALIYEKNETQLDLTKNVDDYDVNIGDTVTYTVEFKAGNYDSNGSAAKPIASYTIEDTLPAFLSDVTVTSIIVDEDDDPETTTDQHDVTAQFTDNKITVDWYDTESEKSLYANGASVTITYTAVVTEQAAIDGAGNTNTVTLTWKYTDGKSNSTESTLTAKATIYTYAIALKKVNDKGENLADATFEFPFYVKADPAGDEAYIYAGTTAGTGLKNQLTTPDSGEITIKGVAAGNYSITEVTAPDGYNKLTTPVTVTAAKTGTTTTSTMFYLDANGNILPTNEGAASNATYENNYLAATAVLVVNKTGAELPSTGGMGTTIFYVVGAVLVLGAVVLLVTRKRMNNSER